MVSKKEYEKMYKKASPATKSLKNMTFAFFVGGAICTLGEFLKQLYITLGLTEKNGSLMSSVSLIFISAVLTGLGIYHSIAKYAGAGTLVPITGFANSVVSPAIEFKTEGFVTGLGAKIFIICGPVILYGTLASVIYGLIYWLTKVF